MQSYAERTATRARLQWNAGSVQGLVWLFQSLRDDTGDMVIKDMDLKMAMTAVCLYFGLAALGLASAADSQYTSDGQLKLPEHYREWVYLSTGFDMRYDAGGQADHHMFDNVFVNPEAYRVFLATGSWPDHTMMVLELRGAEGRGSINQAGNYQSSDVMGVEVHVRDSARFDGKWAFFGFDGGKTAKMIPKAANCYSCHAEHGAVDTTFVQFYPTLKPVAKSKGTYSSGDAAGK